MNDSVIRTQGLTKRYGSIVAVDGLSMEVPRGRIFGLLGPNGSGKTTTLSILLGLTTQTSGNFSLFGGGGSHTEALHRIGAIVETPAFYPYLSGRRNLAYFQGITGKGNRAELDSLLDTVGLGTRANDKFHTYSLGMKQRLGLAYALLGDPEILILDEPTNGMDPAGMAEIRTWSAGSAPVAALSSSPATYSTRLRQSVTAWRSSPGQAHRAGRCVGAGEVG